MTSSARVSRLNSKDQTARVFLKEIEDRAVRGTRAVAEKLYSLSQDLVPKDTGVLARSGRVTEVGEGFDKVFYVGYGGHDIPEVEVYSPNQKLNVIRKPSEYAVIVHEVPYKHAVGQADFLGQPLNNNQDDLRRALHEEVSK